MSRGDADAAIERYREIVTLDPAWIGAHEALARLYFSTNQGLPALDEINLAVAQTPGDPFLLDVRADVLLRLRRPADAAADSQKAIKLAPNRDFARRISRKLKNLMF